MLSEAQLAEVAAASAAALAEMDAVARTRSGVRRTQAGPGLDPDAPGAEREPQEPDQAPRFLSAAQVMDAPAADEVVEGMLTAGGITILAAESGGSKTFVATDLGAAIGDEREREWHGRMTKWGSVAYVKFEADAMGPRLQALKGKGEDLTNLYFLTASEPLSPRGSRDGIELPSPGEELLIDRLRHLSADLAARGMPPIAAVILDTLRASLVGSEDQSECVSAYLRAVRRVLACVPGADAIVLHHLGWQDGDPKRKRERGSSALRGNVDNTLLLEVTDDHDPAEVRLLLTVLKARDADRGAPIRLIRRRVELEGHDWRRNPLTSCVIMADHRTHRDEEREQQAARQLEDRALDLKILATMKAHPVTSQAAIRDHVARKQPAVDGSVARLLSQGLALRGTKRGSPYTLTASGERALQP